MNIKYRIIIFPKNKRQGSVHVNDQSTIWWKHITYYLISIANFSCYALSVFKDKIDNWTMDCKKSTHVINFFCYFYYFYVVFMQKPFKLKIDVGIKLLRQTYLYIDLSTSDESKIVMYQITYNCTIVWKHNSISNKLLIKMQYHNT